MRECAPSFERESGVLDWELDHLDEDWHMSLYISEPLLFLLLSREKLCAVLLIINL